MSHVTFAGVTEVSVSQRRNGRGAFVVIVGPDGVGKTTVARTLMDQYGGASFYFHFLPPVLGALESDPEGRAVPHRGKGVPRGSRVLGWLRLLRSFARYWLAYAVRVRPSVLSGALVIGDRGSYV